MPRGRGMSPTRRRRKRADTTPPAGPSIADFYRAMLGGTATPIAVPTYQDYLTWRNQVLGEQS